MTDLERMTLLARRARAAFERVARWRGWDPSLGGWCLDASMFLREMARANGLQVDIGCGYGHYFTLLGDTVVDITATQFDVKEPVAILLLEEAAKVGPWWKMWKRDTEPTTVCNSGLSVDAERALAETDLEVLIRLATRARVVFERFAAQDRWSPNLGGLCHDATQFIRRMANAHGIPTFCGGGSGHWFVLYEAHGEPMVVDITATQFEQPEKVMVLPLKEAAKRGRWWDLREKEESLDSYERIAEDVALLEGDLPPDPFEEGA